MVRFVLLQYDDSVSYRSMTIPKGAEVLASAQDLERLAAKTAAMVGSDLRTLTDGGDRDAR